MATFFNAATLELAKTAAKDTLKAAAERTQDTLKAAAEHTLNTLTKEDAPTFDTAIERAVQAMEVAQKALCQAASLAPVGPNRRLQRDECTVVHEQLGALAATVKVIQGRTEKPSRPPAIDLLGGAQTTNSGSADESTAVDAAPGGAFGAFSPPATEDLLGLGSFDAAPAANPGASSSSSCSTLEGLDSFFSEPQPSLDDLMNGMSASDELTMAVPLTPEGMGGGAADPAKRLKLPPAMQADAPPEPEEPLSVIERRVAEWQEGKNLQAMLATLHEIIPKCCRWEPRSLGALLDEGSLKDAYKLALIAIHTDKLVNRPEWERARCQLIFNCLRRNRPRATTVA